MLGEWGLQLRQFEREYVVYQVMLYVYSGIHDVDVVMGWYIYGYEVVLLELDVFVAWPAVLLTMRWEHVYQGKGK